jgi:hypothetical protein
MPHTMMDTLAMLRETTSLTEKPVPLEMFGARKRSSSICSSESSEIFVEESSCKKSRRSKAVSFDLSHNTTSAPHYMDEDVDDITLWFSPNELYFIRVREAKIIKEARCSDEYIDQVSCLLELACATIQPANELKLNNEGSDEDSFASDASSIEAPMWISNSPARGLEREMLPCFRQRRKEAIRSFLKSQMALQSWRCPEGRGFSPDFQQRALSEYYQKLSRPAAYLAQLLGEGDAMVCTTVRAVEEDEDFTTFQW